MKKKFCIGLLIGIAIIYQLVAAKGYQNINSETASQEIATESDVPEINWDSVPQLTESNVTEQETSESQSIITAPEAMTVDAATFDKCYAYSTLSEEEKQLYNEMYTTIINHENNARLTTKDLNELEKVYYAIDADNSEIFWIEGYSYAYYTVNGEVDSIEFSPKYIFTKDEVSWYQTQIDKNVDIFLSGINTDMSDYEKSKYVYEVLINNIDYDITAENNQSIVSAFLNGRTVCKGYASAAQYLFKRLGIESVVVNGYANNESHAWNIIKLDGSWYHFDATWGNSKYKSSDDTVEKFVDYGYLNVTENEIRKTHAIQTSFPIPECNTKDNNYFVKENRYITEWDEDKIGSIMKDAWESGRQSCDIKFADSNIYESTISCFFDDKHIGKYCYGLRYYTYFENKTENIITIRFAR